MARHGGPGIEERQEAERREALEDIRMNQNLSRHGHAHGRHNREDHGQPGDGPNLVMALGTLAAILFGIVLVLTL